MSDSAIEYNAREPPSKNEFQLVNTPHIPPMMATLAIIILSKAFDRATAETKPSPCSADTILSESNIKPTARITKP